MYFSNKFGYIEKQVASMRCETEGSKIIKKRFNLRLAAMIRAYNVVHLELLEMNTFFCSFIGFCLVHFFFLVILVGSFKENFFDCNPPSLKATSTND